MVNTKKVYFIPESFVDFLKKMFIKKKKKIYLQNMDGK